MKTISLLLGAGFSIPAGYPDANAVNERVKNTRKENFIVDNEGIVRFGTYPQDSSIVAYCYYTHHQELLAAIDYYITNKGPIQYEEFYDYLRMEIQEDEDFKFYCSNSLRMNIDSFFCQSLPEIYSQILRFYISPHNGASHVDYNPFIKMVQDIANDGYLVHIHTLNHDLLLEELLLEKYSDGFLFENSEYYIENKQNKIKISKYQNYYSKNIRLYKLHGSFDQFLCDKEGFSDWVKVRPGDNFTKIRDEQGYSYLWNYHPSFLTGKESKKIDYRKSLYNNLLCHFESDLCASDVLVIIGYGGNDEGINDLLKEHHGRMIVISPNLNTNFINEMRNAGWKVKTIKKPFQAIKIEDYHKFVNRI